MSASVPRPVCVLRLSALGDVVLAVPAVRALARARPGTRIDWLTSRALVPLLRGLPDNVRLIGLDKPRGLADYLAIRRQLAAERYELLLAMQASLRANLIYPLIDATRKLGYAPPLARDGHRWFTEAVVPASGAHLLDGFMAFAAASGARDLAVEWKLQLDPAAAQWARDRTQDRDYWLLNPCASKPERDWPLQRNIDFARAAQSRHSLPLVLCGSGAQAERAAAAIAEALPDTLNLVGQTTLPQLFALIAQARVLVSPDSGPVHIARAFDVPVVGLYASARAQKTGPYQQLQWTVDAYDAAARALLGKSAQELPWDARMRDARAMEFIRVDAVLEKFGAALSAPRAAATASGT